MTMRHSILLYLAVILIIGLATGCAGGGPKHFVIGSSATNLSTVRMKNIRGDGESFFSRIDGVKRRDISVVRDYLFNNPDIAFTPADISIAPGAHAFGVTYILSDTPHKLLTKKSSTVYQNRYLKAEKANNYITIRHYEELAFHVASNKDYIISSEWSDKESDIQFVVRECEKSDMACTKVNIERSNIKSDAVSRLIDTSDAEWPDKSDK